MQGLVATTSSSVTESKSHTVGVSLDSDLYKGLKAGVKYDYSTSTSTTYGTATTQETRKTQTVGPDQMGWWEFTPYLTRSFGWLKATYDVDVLGSKEWYYPGYNLDTMEVVSPRTINGFADGDWKYVTVPCSSVSLVSAHSGKCLDLLDGRMPSSDGSWFGRVGLYDCNRQWNQDWVFINPDLKQIKVGGSACLSVVTYPGAKVGVTALNCATDRDGAEAKGQVWDYSAVGGKIVNASNGKCLDVRDAKTDNRAWVGIYDCHDASNQKWKLRR
jgi:hypothetical protein